VKNAERRVSAIRKFWGRENRGQEIRGDLRITVVVVEVGPPPPPQIPFGSIDCKWDGI